MTREELYQATEQEIQDTIKECLENKKEAEKISDDDLPFQLNLR